MRGRRLLGMVSSGLMVTTALVVPGLLTTGPAGGAARIANATGGDFDGDGKVDLAIGAPGHNRVRVRYTRAPSTVYLHPNAASTISMGFGRSLAYGDFNGDGYSDLAVGAPNFLPPGQTGGFGNPETEGAVFEFRGSPTGLHGRTLRLTGPYDGDEPYNLGDALAAADVNRDGMTDLAVTLHGADNGNIRVFRGSSIGLTTDNEQFLDAYEASSLAFGDFNGDHYPDLLAGLPVNLINDPGVVMIFAGRAVGRLRLTPQVIGGGQVGTHGANARFGAAVAAGDLNDDGYSEAVIGAINDIDNGIRISGSIVVLHGSATGLAASRHQHIYEARIHANTHRYDHFGAALAIVRVTSDRYPDLIVGSPGEEVSGHDEAGAVYLLRGTSFGVSVRSTQRFTQNSAGVHGVAGTNAHFGAALFARQIVGTGNGDVAIGAPNASFGTAHGGLVIGLVGAPGGLTTVNAGHVAGTLDNDHLGTAIA